MDSSCANELLIETNYGSWCKRIDDLLGDKGLLDHIQKMMSCPDAGLTKGLEYAHFQWEQDDKRAKEILLSQICSHIEKEYKDILIIKDIWDALFLKYGNDLAVTMHPLIPSVGSLLELRYGLDGDPNSFAPRIPARGE